MNHLVENIIVQLKILKIHNVWSEQMKIALCVLGTFEIPEDKVFDALQDFRP